MKYVCFKFSFLAVFLVSFVCMGSEITKSFTLNYSNSEFRIKKSGYFYKGRETANVLFDSKKFVKNYKPGRPALPVEMIKVAVPNGAEFKGVEVSFDKEFFTDLIPESSQPPVLLIENPVIPKRVEPLERIYDSKTGNFPKNIAEYRGTQEVNRYTVFSFNISPMLFNTLEKRTYIAKEIRLKIKYDIKSASSVKKHDNGVFYNILKNSVINPEDLEKPVSFRGEGDIEYLIITTDALKEKFEPLRKWKTEKGVRAEIITMEKIRTDYTGSSDKEKMRACIKDYHQNKKTMWVLLGGDPDLVTDYNAEANSGSDDESDPTIPYDIGFVCIDGDGEYTGQFEDTTQDLFIGRASVLRAEEAEAFVNKTIKYEKNPAKEEFTNNMLLTGVNLFGDPTDNPTDAQLKNLRMWNDYLVPSWETGTKFELHDSYSDFDNDVTRENLEEVINNGYGFIHMSTHGNQQIWSMESGSSFNHENGSAQTNLNKQGIITSIACIINAVDTDGKLIFNGNETLFDNDPCLTESFLRNPNGGAVACVANTRVGLGTFGEEFGLSFMLVNGFYKSVFTDKTYNIGSAVAASKLSLTEYEEFEDEFMGEALRWCHYVFDLAGDPELNVWTDDPSEFTSIEYPDSIGLGADVNITVKTGTESALVCLSNGSDVYEYGKTGEDGNFTASINTSSEDPIKVVVTAHNKVPYIGAINSSGVGISDNTPYSAKLYQNYPNPFNPETIINFEIPKNSKVSLQVYNVKGELVRELVNNNLKAGYHTTKFNGAEFTSGVYYYMLKADNKTIAKKKMVLLK